ncbi:L-type lectin-domain containing protein [Vagococcus fessus]|uniref:WxL domain-containing protein n=1 Tax=Vagococcus fessus TaxID=120370 RepID=A0A430A8F1_9ENTE|nr:L-type lectin-domain containing protein [Vagococcus fessus]RSU03388.1 hypothetical protein CBF31_06660 [Vagococcus fessus]
MKKFICLMSLGVMLGSPISSVAVGYVGSAEHENMLENFKDSERREYMLFTLDYLSELKETKKELKEDAVKAKNILEEISIKDKKEFSKFSEKFTDLTKALDKEHPKLIKLIDVAYTKEAKEKLEIPNELPTSDTEKKETVTSEGKNEKEVSSSQTEETAAKSSESSSESKETESEAKSEESVETEGTKEESSKSEEKETSSNKEASQTTEKEENSSKEKPSKDKESKDKPSKDKELSADPDDFIVDGVLTEAGLKELTKNGDKDEAKDLESYAPETFKKTPEQPTEDIISKAPRGLALDQIFATEDIQGNAYVTKEKVTNTDIVVMTDSEKNKGKDQVSSIWSTDPMKIDLEHDFEAEMSLYLGGNEADAADGMAFVLQNDSVQGTKAIGKGGASLGVYGDPAHTTNVFKKESIQNSFAVEFDTHTNRGTLDKRMPRMKVGQKNGWTGGLIPFPIVRTGYKTYYNRSAKQHIAATYPAYDNPAGKGMLPGYQLDFYPDTPYMKSPAGYKGGWIGLEQIPANTDPNKLSPREGLLNDGNFYYNKKKTDALPIMSYSSWFKNYPVINHDTMFYSQSLFDGSKQNLANGKWHDFTVKYLAPSKHEDMKDMGTMELTFDGKKIKTVRALDFQALGIDPKSDVKNIRWGFTAATGKKASTQAVVFKQIPDLINVKHEEDILDEEGQSIYKDGDKTKIPDVDAGQQVTYQTSVEYISGKQSWLNPEIISTITPYGQYVNNSYEVSFDEGKTWTKLDDDNPDEIVRTKNDITAKLDKTISLEGPTKVMTRFKVDIDPTDVDLLVKEKVRYFGKNDSFLSDTLQYTIKQTPMKADMVITNTLTDSPIDGNNDMVIGSISNIQDPYKDTKMEVVLTGDDAVEGEVVPVSGKGDTRSFTFTQTNGKTFTASNRIRAKLVPAANDKQEIISVASKEVLDKTAPTGTKEAPVTTFKRTKTEAESLEVDPMLFVTDIEDTNPTVNPEDIKVELVDEELFRKNIQTLTNGAPHKVKVHLEDPSGNVNETIATELYVVDPKDRIELRADDEFTVMTGEVKDPSKEALLPEEELTPVLEEAGNWQGIYREEDLTESDISEYIQPDYTDMKHTPGRYPVNLHLEYQLVPEEGGEEGGESRLAKSGKPFTPLKYKVKFLTKKEADKIRKSGRAEENPIYTTDDKLVYVNVIDGDLEMEVEGDLSYKGKLQSKETQLKPETDMKVTIKDGRTSEKGWELSVKNSPFTDKNNTRAGELPLSLVVLNKDGSVQMDLNSSEQTIKTGDEKSLELSLGKSSEDQHLETKVGASSHTWGNPDMEYTSEITWNIKPQNDTLSKITDKLSAKKGADK